MEKKYEFYLADLKKFDAEANGFEFGGAISKGVFIKKDDKFINVFDSFDERSVYVRSRHTGEYRNNNEQYGTKVKFVNGTGYDDYAWIIYDSIYADLTEMENFVLYSNDYYKDRVNIASRRLVESNDLHEKYRMYRILEKDSMYLDENKKSSKKLIK